MNPSILITGVVGIFLFAVLGMFLWSDRKKALSILSYATAFGIFLLLAYVADKYDKEHQDACKRIGGHYIIVGHERVGKTNLAIYGCVKER